jgi:hypothetical protein
MPKQGPAPKSQRNIKTKKGKAKAKEQLGKLPVSYSYIYLGI